MRIIIDGTVGAGKTTIVTGMSERDESNSKYPCLKELGYPVFTELIVNVIKKMRNSGFADPSDNWDVFFEWAVKDAINSYNAAEPNTINFYDRGIYFMEIMARRYERVLPRLYYDFIEKNRYDNPVLVFEPILTKDMTKPHKTDSNKKIYSNNDRLIQHAQIVNLYKKYGYEVVEIPVYCESVIDSINMRIEKVKELLKI